MTITVEGGRFLRNGAPHQIISGALHYFRIPTPLWRDRLARVAALGVNTIETYVAWNFHERTRGEIDFTGPRDLARFISLAGDLGLDVLVRPGPYICAEWDFGGLPAWLMRDRVSLRSSDPAFLAAADAWLDAVTAVIAPLQASHGGPVVGVQVENEYGSYGSDASYLAHVRDRLVAGGIDCWLFTSDGPGPDWLSNGTLPDVTATANFGSRPQANLAELTAFRPGQPAMVMEWWNGWFDHWGEPHHVRDAHEAASVLAELLGRGASVNLYMAHGGTNMGLWNGANHTEDAFAPTITSYDYDAAVGEAGELGATFLAFRDVIAAHTGVEPPAPPAPLPRQSPSAPTAIGWASLLDHTHLFDKPQQAATPLSLEDLGADHGLVLYRGTTLVPPDGRHLLLDGLADRAHVIVDGVDRGTFDRNDGTPRIPMTPRTDGRPTALTILVENQGRSTAPASALPWHVSSSLPPRTPTDSWRCPAGARVSCGSTTPCWAATGRSGHKSRCTPPLLSGARAPTRLWSWSCCRQARRWRSAIRPILGRCWRPPSPADQHSGVRHGAQTRPLRNRAQAMTANRPSRTASLTRVTP